MRTRCDCSVPTVGFTIGEFWKCPACRRWWQVRALDASARGAWHEVRAWNLSAHFTLEQVLSTRPELSIIMRDDIAEATAR